MRFWIDRKEFIKILKRLNTVVTDKARYGVEEVSPINTLYMKADDRGKLTVSSGFRWIRFYHTETDDLIVVEEPGEVCVFDGVKDVLGLLNVRSVQYVCVSIQLRTMDDAEVPFLMLDDVVVCSTDATTAHLESIRKILNPADRVSQFIDASALKRAFEMHAIIPKRKTQYATKDNRIMVLGSMVVLRSKDVRIMSTDVTVLADTTVLKSRVLKSLKEDTGLLVPTYSVEQAIKFLRPIRGDIQISIISDFESTLVLRTDTETYAVNVSSVDHTLETYFPYKTCDRLFGSDGAREIQIKRNDLLLVLKEAVIRSKKDDTVVRITVRKRLRVTIETHGFSSYADLSESDKSGRTAGTLLSIFNIKRLKKILEKSQSDTVDMFLQIEPNARANKLFAFTLDSENTRMAMMPVKLKKPEKKEDE